MALWLELIPKIHKPDTFDPNLHLLDDPKNDSTFEPVGTRSLDSPLSPWAPDWRDDFSEAEDLEGALPEEVEDEKLDLNRGLQNYPDKDLGRDPTSKTQGGKIPGDLSNRPKKLPTSNGDLDGEPEASSSQMSVKSKVSTQDKYNELLDQGGEAATGGSHDSVSGHRQVNNPNPKTNQQSEPDKRSSTDFDKQSGQSSTLTLTVSVGCALLLLNCVVFAATFCQWHRFGRTPRNREPEAEMLKDKMAIATTSGCIQETEFYGRGVHPSFFHSKDLNQHPYRQCTSSSPSAAMAAVSIATTTTTIDADSPYKYNHLLPTQPTHMKPPPRSTPVQSAVAMTSSSHVTENHVTGTDHDHAKFDQSQQTSSHSTTIV